MSVLEWKNFNLYKLIPVLNRHKLMNIKAEIISQCYNELNRIFCDATGWVHVFFQNWECVSFQADSKPINFCAITDGKSNILVTLAQDDVSNDLYIKIFDIQKLTKKNGAVFLSLARLSSVLSSVTVIKACLVGTQLCTAIGFQRGEIYLFRGNVSRDLSSSFRIFPVSTRTINGIAFKQKDNIAHYMFVSSNAGIFCYTITDSNTVCETKTVLDSSTDSTHCYDLRSNYLGDAYFTVARDNAIYCFTNDGRGPCYILDGEKIAIAWFGNNLIVVIHQKNTSCFPVSTTLLIIVDIKNKIIVLNKEVEYIESIIVEQTQCFLITKSKQIFVLRERNMQSKIRMLLKKNLFDVALNQLESCDSDQRSVAEVNLQYGDYLFQKGEIEKAIEMYNKTIGILEPYCVISKLLDTRYTKYLIQYLQLLVQTDGANKEHFELLINCKERIDLPARLESQCLNGDLEESYPIRSFVADVNRTGFNMDVINSTDVNSQFKLMHNEESTYTFFKNMEEDDIFECITENKDRFNSHNAATIVSVLKTLVDKRKIINAERFMALLIPNKNDCMDFLEHVIQIFDGYSDKILDYLFEFYLQTFEQSNKKSEEFLVEFLKRHETRLNTEKNIVLCRIYSFWLGIIYFLDRNYDQSLSVLYLTKSANVSYILENVSEWEKLNTNIWLQVLQKNKLNMKLLPNYVNFLLYAMMNKKPRSLLEILQNFLSNTSVHVCHVKDFFEQELIKNIHASNCNRKVIAKLRIELVDVKSLLDNFSCKPIEFRNSICDKCRNELTLPAVYFLCQHAFHKDCLGFYSKNNVCIICPSNLKPLSLDNKNYETKSNLKFQKIPFDGAIGEVSKLLRNGIVNQFFKENTIDLFENQVNYQQPPHYALNTESNKRTSSNSQWAGRFDISSKSTNVNSNTIKPKQEKQSINTNPFEIESTNPFEKYDDNLNPFAEK